MYWIHSFELLCYALTAALLADIVRKKNVGEAKLFLSGAIAGFALELLAVRVTDIYHYNPGFWLNLGREPYQFPVFGGLMWGGLTVCGLKIARRMGFGKGMTALVTGFLIVSMDLLLDVVAIRLDGGFWVWEGRDINTAVDHHMWMSVIWVNFLGYLFETPMVAWLSLKDWEKPEPRPWWKHLLSAVLIALAGIAFVGAASGLSLWLNVVTDEWFACIAFVCLWLGLLTALLLRLARMRPQGPRQPLSAAFFAAMYIYCLAAIIHLGIAADHPWTAVLCLALAGGTIYLAERSPQKS